MNSRNEFGWSDGFGDSKAYCCYALRCCADIVFCARQLELLLRWNCSFMGEHVINIEEPQVSGEVFVAVFDVEKKANCFLLPNHFLIPDTGGTNLNLFSMEESFSDYYLFSKKGTRKFRCNSAGYEYLLLFSADEGFDLKQITGVLANEPRLPVEELSDRIIPSAGTSRNSPVSSFLKHLFIGLELAKRDYDKLLTERFLGGVCSISDSNFPIKPLCGIEPTIAPMYLEREDI